jgi:prophage regulatory protein
MPEQCNDLGRVLRAREVCRRIGLSRPTLWRLVRDNKFPSPFRLSSPSAVGWAEREVVEWIAQRAADRFSKQDP